MAGIAMSKTKQQTRMSFKPLDLFEREGWIGLDMFHITFSAGLNRRSWIEINSRYGKSDEKRI